MFEQRQNFPNLIVNEGHQDIDFNRTPNMLGDTLMFNQPLLDESQLANLKNLSTTPLQSLPDHLPLAQPNDIKQVYIDIRKNPHVEMQQNDLKIKHGLVTLNARNERQPLK